MAFRTKAVNLLSFLVMKEDMVVVGTSFPTNFDRASQQKWRIWETLFGALTKMCSLEPTACRRIRCAKFILQKRQSIPIFIQTVNCQVAWSFRSPYSIKLPYGTWDLWAWNMTRSTFSGSCLHIRNDLLSTCQIWVCAKARSDGRTPL